MSTHPPGGRRLRDLDEGELLDVVLPLFGPGRGVLVGPGDDAAVVAADSGSLVATTDALVRGRDWRDEWSSAADVGVKAVTQNVADVAAMGAVPLTLLLTLVADPDTTLAWVTELAASMASTARDAGAGVAGGDLSSAPPGTLVLSVTALGDLEGRDPVLRGGAAPGDVVAVAGTLGRSGAGLWLLEHGTPTHGDTHGGTHGAAGGDGRGTTGGVGDPERSALAAELLRAHRRPVAPVHQGPVAARAGARAMIDLSDGLVRDAGRVARASGVGVDLAGDLLAGDVDHLRPLLTREEARSCVLSGGEEHSLLAAFQPGGALPPGWRPLGRVVRGEGVTVDGVPVGAGGWDHFRR